ncbi:MAG: IS110 family transposase [Chloroflexota bacterium]|nr:IS110 family transposase [Chloroflexota bacterium]
MSTLVVGVDIAQDTFVAASWHHGSGQLLGMFPNSDAGFTALVAALPTVSSIHLVMEPTGGFELPLAMFAIRRGWRVSLPNPRQVRDFAKGRGRRAKTDPQDALVLARFGAEANPPAWQPLPSEVAELESLVRRRDDLQDMLRQERNRQQALERRPHQHQSVPRSLERLVDILTEELAAVERAIADHINQYTQLAEAARRLRTLPGVGPQTVAALLVVLWRWQVLTEGEGSAKGLTAYVGLDPQPHQSGTSVNKPSAISRMGERGLRRKLFMATLGGLRGASPLRMFYERLVGRGKAKKVAIVAAMRKLVCWAWVLFRTQSLFDPSKFAYSSTA